MRYFIWYVACIVWFLCLVTLCSACATFGPSSWGPNDHIYMMRACSVSCRNHMTGYIAMDGECKCRK